MPIAAEPIAAGGGGGTGRRERRADAAEIALPKGPAHRIRRRCRRRQFDRGLARAVAGLAEIAIECAAGSAAADHRDPRRNQQRAGMQLRLVAGPLSDAAAAAKICAVLSESDRDCETTVFDGQRLAFKPDDARLQPLTPAPRRRVTQETARKSARRRGAGGQSRKLRDCSRFRQEELTINLR